LKRAYACSLLALKIHVELGSGDGRVNFFAIEAGVKQSIGVDVDEGIVQVANDRLNRIHPKPNIRFLVADLMESTNPAWKEVENATILTMYFAKEGLEKIRERVEYALRGKRCKIFTCGYAMPGWESQVVETVLDMPIHFYDWGNTEVDDSFLSDSFIENIPQKLRTPDMDKFMKKKNSTFKPDPLLGYHPDDLIDYGWDDFEDAPLEEEETK
jgi:SAM-dependent methyltransferase